MRIAVISSQVFPCPPRGYAGLEMIAYHTAGGLAKLGHSVTLIAPDGSRCDGCDLFHTGPPDGNEHRAYDAYWKHLPSYECVIDHSWQKWPLQLKAEGRLPQPVLCVLHAPVNTMMQSPPQVPNPCVVCISEDQASHYAALFNAPARVCYNGVDVNYYRPMTVKRTDRFLFLARFSRIKGADIAIRACLDAGVGLDLVGDTSITNEPDYLQECYSLASKTSPNWDASVRGRQIAIHGGASRGECVRWFSQAFALLHPVRDFREPLGLAPLECQACSTPVITWRNGAMPETVSHGVTGWIVDSFEQLVEAIREDVVSQIDRSKCRLWVASKFTCDTMVRRYEELCHEAIRTGGW